uniref:Uncharacterized protein n=1 Tax=Arundo donax TaxID=35708 RepID=A0A0A9APS3_ARUDO
MPVGFLGNCSIEQFLLLWFDEKCGQNIC